MNVHRGLDNAQDKYIKLHYIFCNLNFAAYVGNSPSGFVNLVVLHFDDVLMAFKYISKYFSINIAMS